MKEGKLTWATGNKNKNCNDSKHFTCSRLTEQLVCLYTVSNWVSELLLVNVMKLHPTLCRRTPSVKVLTAVDIIDAWVWESRSNRTIVEMCYDRNTGMFYAVMWEFAKNYELEEVLFLQVHSIRVSLSATPFWWLLTSNRCLKDWSTLRWKHNACPFITSHGMHFSSSAYLMERFYKKQFWVLLIFTLLCQSSRACKSLIE